MEHIKEDMIKILRELIRIPSYSKKEGKASDYLEGVMKNYGLETGRRKNNLWSVIYHGDYLPVILLNSHIDTVQPAEDWITDPFDPGTDKGKINGLGSNDAGASLVALLGAFLYFSEMTDLPFNLVFAVSAEEEISGKNGIEQLLQEISPVHLGIVGEPTGMKMAVAEKGLMVIDCVAEGRSFHAARNGGINAIYKAIGDIEWIRNYRFPKKSSLLGEVKMQVTKIEAGHAHNVVPGNCSFVLDVRINDQYSNKEIFRCIREHISSNIQSRSFRLNSSSIPINHPVVLRALELGIECIGSGTLSDQALMHFPTVKIGPGDPLRSHTAGEYILVEEINNGIDTYVSLLNNLIIS